MMDRGPMTGDRGNVRPVPGLRSAVFMMGFPFGGEVKRTASYRAAGFGPRADQGKPVA
jgi:hypothetical protein